MFYNWNCFMGRLKLSTNTFTLTVCQFQYFPQGASGFFRRVVSDRVNTAREKLSHSESFTSRLVHRLRDFLSSHDLSQLVLRSPTQIRAKRRDIRFFSLWYCDQKAYYYVEQKPHLLYKKIFGKIKNVVLWLICAQI